MATDGGDDDQFRSSSSSSSSIPSARWNYDVFLSFRGRDTRKGFTDHLYAALLRAGIHTFRDDNEIEGGGDIGPECLKAIEGSRFSIVVLSKGYATSTWCLDELAHILECKKTLGHKVWPIFYNVDPYDVEEPEKGCFAEAFRAHKKQFKNEMEKVDSWKNALVEVSYLKGLDLPNHADGHEARNIEEIVNEISSKLNRTKLNVAIYPVNLHSRANEVIALLDEESLDDVRVVGIYGMGGIGKTTIAKEVYNEVYDKFEASSFLESVREKSDRKGVTQLQRQLLSETLRRKHEKIYNADGGLRVIQERLRCKRVLIVFDDVEKIDQLHRILGNLDWFCPGSRVIITTRIKDFLQPSKLYHQYEVKELDDNASLQLLSLHAFDKNKPGEDWMDCAKKVVHHAGGIPLALEVLGSSLRGESFDVWNIRLEKLKLIGNEDIHSILQISYDSLDDIQKYLFLDIACFFIGYSKGFVTSILDDCGFFCTDGIRILIRRCLLRVSRDKLWMHDLLRDMGREIVRRESPTDAGKRSRLWRREDVIDVLTDGMGTEAVEGMLLNLQGPERTWSTKAFKRMKKLRLLQFNYVGLRGTYKYVSNKLRWLCWWECPLEIIPTDLNMENLIVLDMRYSKLKQFSDDVKSLKKLKILKLSHSHELVQTPNFEGCPSLEKLMLKDCISLEKVQDSIGLLTCLHLLNLRNCKSLKNLPGSICNLPSLGELNLSGCSMLSELPENVGNLKSLVVLLADETAITTLPETICDLSNLQTLSLRGCHLIYSPTKFPQIILPSSLQKLDVRHCNISDNMMPYDLGGLELLEELKLCGNNFTSLPTSIGNLYKLKTLWLNECRRLRSIPQLHSSLKSLHAQHCPLLESINLINFLGERDLELNGCERLKEIEGFFNLMPLEAETVTKLLKTNHWPTEESTEHIQLHMVNNLTGSCRITPLQALCERGTYSIFLPGRQIPTWFSYQNAGDTIYFPVPPLNPGVKIIGLATCAVYAWKRSRKSCYFNPNITIINKTKKFHWMYTPYITFFSPEVEQEIMWLSYWIFDHSTEGHDVSDMSWRFKDELEQEDLVEFTVDMGLGIRVHRCGVHLLYQAADQGFQSNDVAIIFSASSRHNKRFLKSIPRWLSAEHPRKIKSEFISDVSSDVDYKGWVKQREQRVNETPDYDSNYVSSFPSTSKSHNLGNRAKSIHPAYHIFFPTASDSETQMGREKDPVASKEAIPHVSLSPVETVVDMTYASIAPQPQTVEVVEVASFNSDRELINKSPPAMAAVETAQAVKTPLPGKSIEINARQGQQNSLADELSRLAEEETRLQAEIERLIAEKVKLLVRKHSIAKEKERDPCMERPSKEEDEGNRTEDKLQQKCKHLQQERDSIKQPNSRTQHRSSTDSSTMVKAPQLLDNSPRNLTYSLEHGRSSPSEVEGGRHSDKEILRERMATTQSGKQKTGQLFEAESDSEMSFEGKGEEVIIRSSWDGLVKESDVRSVCYNNSDGDDEDQHVESKKCSPPFYGQYCCSCSSSASSSSSSFVCDECRKRGMVMKEEEKVASVEKGKRKVNTLSGLPTRWIVTRRSWVALGLLVCVIGVISMRSFGGSGDPYEIILVPT